MAPIPPMSPMVFASGDLELTLYPDTSAKLTKHPYGYFIDLHPAEVSDVFRLIGAALDHVRHGPKG